MPDSRRGRRSVRKPRPPIPPDFLDRFAWHPEPELLGIRDPETAREALRAAGAATWEAGLDYLYDHALDRAMGEATGFGELRSRYFGPSGEPGPAPVDPTPLPTLLEEFRERIAPHTASAFHPRSFGYFTPPPLVASIVGEVLSQFAQQGVDIFHAGPIAATMEEEVVRWLCDLVGYDRDSFGLLTSGGVRNPSIHAALVARIWRMRAGRQARRAHVVRGICAVMRVVSPGVWVVRISPGTRSRGVQRWCPTYSVTG